MELVLQPIQRFAARWHSKPWALSSLAAAVGAKVLVEDSEPDVLGTSVSVGRNFSIHTIALNSIILETPLYVPILVHECAHCILKHILGLCENDWVFRQMEREAWLGAAWLAVSDAQVGQIRRDELSVREVACRNGVPVQLIRLGLALRTPTQDMSSPLSVERSLEVWRSFLATEANELR